MRNYWNGISGDFHQVFKGMQLQPIPRNLMKLCGCLVASWIKWCVRQKLEDKTTPTTPTTPPIPTTPTTPTTATTITIGTTTTSDHGMVTVEVTTTTTQLETTTITTSKTKDKKPKWLMLLHQPEVDMLGLYYSVPSATTIMQVPAWPSATSVTSRDILPKIVEAGLWLLGLTRSP